MDRKDQAVEAVARMGILDILPNVRREFAREGKVEVSERVNKDYPAVLYWSENYNGLDEKIAEFEEKNGGLVYHVILTHMEFGDTFSFLYVPGDEEEWSMDTNLIKDGECYSYTWNKDAPEMSDYGYIGIKPIMGGVMRTW